MNLRWHQENRWSAPAQGQFLVGYQPVSVNMCFLHEGSFNRAPEETSICNQAIWMTRYSLMSNKPDLALLLLPSGFDSKVNS